jgi:hypothetical protein
VAPALEAVAGTLTHLRLQWHPDDVNVGYELGLAVGKLRRLRDLALDLSNDGRVYHAFAQGLAASGGGLPSPPAAASRTLFVPLACPRVSQCRAAAPPAPPPPGCGGFRHARTALLTACALRQAGYKTIGDLRYPPEVKDAAGGIAPQCRFGGGSVGDVFGFPWGFTCGVIRL